MFMRTARNFFALRERVTLRNNLFEAIFEYETNLIFFPVIDQETNQNVYEGMRTNDWVNKCKHPNVDKKFEQ